MDEAVFEVEEKPVPVSGLCPGCGNPISLRLFERHVSPQILTGASYWSGELQCRKCGSLIRLKSTPELFEKAPDEEDAS